MLREIVRVNRVAEHHPEVIHYCGGVSGGNCGCKSIDLGVVCLRLGINFCLVLLVSLISESQPALPFGLCGCVLCLSLPEGMMRLGKLLLILGLTTE